MDPLSLTREIEQRYRRYLETTFYFKDPELRQSFRQALAEWSLSKGPYLEATPVFKLGQTAAALLSDLMGYAPEEAFLRALLPAPLYKHQEDAIRAIHHGRNVVIATGTASGKTEGFLYPILLHLYQQFRSDRLGPGVRALILYPMNALANDQRERLGALCQTLTQNQGQFRFTFGQYIGETPDNASDRERHAEQHLARRLPGELVLRREMQNTPPHILLTNYSMLEYLLIRPDDSELFDHGRSRWWTFLVLDEAHQYRGARGIEMAMLLRRLKQRLREGGHEGPLRCVATSATLAQGDEDRTQVAEFASRLFDEPFAPDDVLLGEREAIPDRGTFCLSREDYQVLRDGLNRVRPKAGSDLRRLSVSLGIPANAGQGPEVSVAEILQRDARATHLRKTITQTPRLVADIARQIFPELATGQAQQACCDLANLLLRVCDPGSDAPLLSARYHFFLRSLEGAFVSYWPHKRVALEPPGHEAGAFFEVALCRECGQHYFLAPTDFREGVLEEPIRDPADERFGITYFRPLEDEDERSTDEEEPDAAPGRARSDRVWFLCVQCGYASRRPPPCGHASHILIRREPSHKDEDKADQLQRCSACGYHGAGRDPVREVIHGADGPHTVIATTLHQMLPEGRKQVLAFADSRQEAAFFAWYLDTSYRDILDRNLILNAARRLGADSQHALSLSALARALRNLYRDKDVFPETRDDLDLLPYAWRALYRELLTEEHRLSLEGVGLLYWSFRWPSGLRAAHVFQQPLWSLPEQEARDLVFLLLDFSCADKAVEIAADSGVSLRWADLGLRATHTTLQLERPRRSTGIQSWAGENSRRAQFLTKLLEARGLPRKHALECAVKALGMLWEALVEYSDNADEPLLLRVGNGRRLNPDWWRARLLAPTDTLFRCEICARVQYAAPGGLCLRHRCPGSVRLVPARALEDNHYRRLYQEDLPGRLRVEEHTAQIDKERAREFQRDFREKRIHVLSSSTTFELGVDLGDLDSIFLRNVPPEAFNYAQRVGRAGRRAGFPGFAITYCKRSPHDLYHFHEPDRMVQGVVQPPVLSIRNEKIVTRHMAATALSLFFRRNSSRFGTVQQLVLDLSQPRALADFSRFLSANRPDLEHTLARILPRDVWQPLGLHDGDWMHRIAGPDSRLATAERIKSADFLHLKRLQMSSAEQEDYRRAEWAKERAATIADEYVLDFLSRFAVIPKYGFPVDVVELDPHRRKQDRASTEVSLERDLAIAIAEFAPTSEVVANKKVWKSHGLKIVPERQWDRKRYSRCARHNFFHQYALGEVPVPPPCGCRAARSDFEYIDPQFGFITDPQGPRDPTGRPPRLFTTRPYFVGFRGPEPHPTGSGPLTMTPACPGTMVVLCEGRRGEGFWICDQCGAGFRTRQRSPHVSPYGENCSHSLTVPPVSLGHEFVTDVLQITFHLPSPAHADPIWFGYSVAYALVEGAAAILDVPSTDLSATVRGSLPPVPPVILYDNVPGGAGLVARLEQRRYLVACLDAALKRLHNCGCHEQASCYRCLRNYRNQFAHRHLQRGPVLQYLTTVLQTL